MLNFTSMSFEKLETTLKQNPKYFFNENLAYIECDLSCLHRFIVPSHIHFLGSEERQLGFQIQKLNQIANWVLQKQVKVAVNQFIILFLQSKAVKHQPQGHDRKALPVSFLQWSSNQDHWDSKKQEKLKHFLFSNLLTIKC